MSDHLSPEEIIARRERDQQALASLAIEGMAQTAEDRALFEDFDRAALSDEECRLRVIELATRKLRGGPVQAE